MDVVDILFALLDIASVAVGVALLIVPNTVHRWISRPVDGVKPEPPEKWPITGRVIGGLLLAFGGFFLFSDLIAPMIWG